MYSEFSYQFLLYPKNIYLGYPQIIRLIEVLLNSTHIPIILSLFDSKISKDKYTQFVSLLDEQSTLVVPKYCQYIKTTDCHDVSYIIPYTAYIQIQCCYFGVYLVSYIPPYSHRMTSIRYQSLDHHTFDHQRMLKLLR